MQKTETHAATGPREKGVSEHATSWLVSCVDLVFAERYCKSGEPSIVALKTATLLAAPLVELALRDNPVGEHATNGVARSAMREVKRHTRTLKCALEAHVGSRVTFHLEVDTNDGIRCDQFLQDWQRWLHC